MFHHFQSCPAKLFQWNAETLCPGFPLTMTDAHFADAKPIFFLNLQETYRTAELSNKDFSIKEDTLGNQSFVR